MSATPPPYQPPGPYEQVVQTCYRHPDRRAGVSCQRCTRPICPSCMVTASVGFHCPECAKQGAQQQRLVDVWKQQTAPHLTYGLIALNVLIFLVGTAGGSSFGGLDGQLNTRFGLAARLLFQTTTGGVVSAGGVAEGEWWRVLTAGFLHAGVLHLAMNMYVLYLIGGAMERAIGKVRFGIIYVVSLVGGSLGALLLSPNSLTVGASGAIFGLFGALACLQLSRGINPMQGGIGPTIAINLVITLVLSRYISVGGHVGGLVTGAACGALMFGINPETARARAKQVMASNAVVVAAGVLLFVGSIAVAYR